MKKLLFGLLALGSLSSFASGLDCSFHGVEKNYSLDAKAKIDFQINKKGKAVGSVFASGDLSSTSTYSNSTMKQYKIKEAKQENRVNWGSNSSEIDQELTRTTIYSYEKTSGWKLDVRFDSFSKVGEVVDAIAIRNSKGGMYILSQGSCVVTEL